jgi:hypothetical protein
MFVPIAVGIMVFLFFIVGATLRVDGERVAIEQIFHRASCPREDLMAVQIGIVAGRAPACNFVRKDRSVAFQTARVMWSRRQLQTVADFLGVPLVTGAITRV